MILLCVLALGACLPTTIVQVSARGPVRTIEQALEIVRPLGPGARAEIRLAPGAYLLKRGIRISGLACRLRMVGPSRGEARLIGGRFVDRWSKEADPRYLSRLPRIAGDRVIVADLRAEGIDDLGRFERRGFALPSKPSGLEVFVRGVPMTPARYPNAGGPTGGWLRIADVSSRTSFVAPEPRPSLWSSLEDVWVYGYWKYDWADSHERVVSYDRTQRIVNTESAGGTYGYDKGRRFFYSHVLEELDSPGEWWLDRSNGRLILYPPHPLRTGDVVVSETTDPLLTIAGAKDVAIERLTLEAGRGHGVLIQGSEGCSVERCTIRNFGMAGVVIEGGRACSVIDCEISGNGEGGVSLDGGDRADLTPAGHSVEGCRIHHVSRWCRTYRPAVGVNGVGQRVVGNRMSDLPHNAVLLGGNDHVLERNLVERVCTETGDAGAFYMGRDATMRGTVIRHNRFREIQPTVNTAGNFTEVMSVYLDDCWCGTTIVGNVFESGGTAIMIGGGRDNVVENNVFLGAHVGISFDARGRGWAKGLFQRGGEWGYMERLDAMKPLEPPYSVRYPALASAIRTQADLSYPAGTVVKRNVVAGTDTWIRYLDGLTIKDIDYADNVVLSGKATLAEAIKQAPAGFQPIPLERIGKR